MLHKKFTLSRKRWKANVFQCYPWKANRAENDMTFIINRISDERKCLMNGNVSEKNKILFRNFKFCNLFGIIMHHFDIHNFNNRFSVILISPNMMQYKCAMMHLYLFGSPERKVLSLFKFNF